MSSASFEEVRLEDETLNGIPAPLMAWLIKFQTMTASLYRATRVHHRKESRYGNLPLDTIFKPVTSGAMCKGICHALDLHSSIRILCNCLSRAAFVKHDNVPHVYCEMLKGFAGAGSGDYSSTPVVCEQRASLARIERFLRKLNDEMYDWRGFVRKPMPKRAPFSLFDVDSEYDPADSETRAHELRQVYGAHSDASGLFAHTARALVGCVCVLPWDAAPQTRAAEHNDTPLC